MIIHRSRNIWPSRTQCCGAFTKDLQRLAQGQATDFRPMLCIPIRDCCPVFPASCCSLMIICCEHLNIACCRRQPQLQPLAGGHTRTPGSASNRIWLETQCALSRGRQNSTAPEYMSVHTKSGCCHHETWKGLKLTSTKGGCRGVPSPAVAKIQWAS